MQNYPKALRFHLRDGLGTLVLNSSLIPVAFQNGTVDGVRRASLLMEVHPAAALPIKLVDDGCFSHGFHALTRAQKRL